MTFSIEQEVFPNDLNANDLFGYNVDINNGTMIVGAYQHNTDGISDKGAVYVFVEDENHDWTFQQKLSSSYSTANQVIGKYCRISGDYIVSCNYETWDGSTDGVIVWKRTGATWTYSQLIMWNSDKLSDAVAIDGGYVVISAKNRTINSLGAVGDALVYKHNGTSFIYQSQLPTTDIVADRQYGKWVDISGERAAVGCTYWDGIHKGHVHIFKKNGTTWTLEQVIHNPDSNIQTFGESFCIDGETIVIGAKRSTVNGIIKAGAALVYKLVDGTWTYQQTLTETTTRENNYFGVSVHIRGDKCLVATPYDKDVGGSSQGGAVNVYKLEGETWVLKQRIFDPGTPSADYFGYSCAITDGYNGSTNINIGAAYEDSHGGNAGTSYIYRESEITLPDTILSSTDTIIDNIMSMLESLNLTDNTILTNIAKIVADVLNLTDTLSSFSNIFNMLDTITTNSTININNIFNILESLHLTDIINITGLTSVFDTLNITDNLTISNIFSMLDAISFADIVDVIKEIVKYITDALNLTDNLTLSNIFSMLEEINLTDDITINNIFNILESLHLTDIINSSTIMSVLESLNITDTTNISNIFNMLDSISLVDLFDINYLISLVDSLNFDDSTTISNIFNILESLHLTEDTTISNILNVLDVISFADITNVIKEIVKYITDTLNLTSDINISNIFNMLDDININDIIDIIIDVIFKHISESLNLTDDTSISGILNVLDNISLADTTTINNIFSILDEISTTDILNIISSLNINDFIYNTEDIEIQNALNLFDSLSINDLLSLNPDDIIIRSIFSADIKDFYFSAKIRGD